MSTLNFDYKKAKEICSKLTVKEKADLCSGVGLWHTEAVERLGIKPVMMTDGPHGLRKMVTENGKTYTVASTCMPTASALAASWSEKVLSLAGETIAKEARAEGVAMVLGPGVNMKRTPLCGRNFEYFAEDPYLSGKLASAYISAMNNVGVESCIKHFACNNQEFRRYTTSAEVSERALREIYLSAFELAIAESKPAAVMESYNRINGKHAAESKWLLTDILRGEWGYDGFVMSDWDAVNDRVKSLEAGCDLEMPDSYGNGTALIIKALENGDIDMATLDTAVTRILCFVLAHQNDEAVPQDMSASHDAALSCARECMVLLKNNGALPLEGGKPLAVIGNADKLRFQGSGSSKVVSGNAKVDALAQIIALNGSDVVYVPFEKGADEAVKAAKKCGRAIVFCGLPETAEVEDGDRTHMQLPVEQLDVIAAVASAVENNTVVLTCGAPAEMPFADSANAILLTYLCGDATAEALGEIVFGKTNPSGKLAETFPIRLEDNPSYLNYPGDGDVCSYAEDIYIGYRFYEKKNMAVRFPFGHGLSYTSFEYTNLTVSKDNVTLTVKNTGKTAGFETVQVYVGADAPRVHMPKKILAGFKKVWLDAGEEKTVEISVNERSFTYWEASEHRFVTEGGSYTIYVGSSSADIRCEEKINVKGNRKTLPVDRNTTVCDIIEFEEYAPIRNYFIDAVLPNENHKTKYAPLGYTKENPAIKARWSYCVRQAVYFKRGFTEQSAKEIIEKCNEMLGIKEV